MEEEKGEGEERGGEGRRGGGGMGRGRGRGGGRGGEVELITAGSKSISRHGVRGNKGGEKVGSDNSRSRHTMQSWDKGEYERDKGVQEG